MNTFSTFHPLLLVAYFVVVVGIVVSSMHPIVIILTAIGGVSYFCAIRGYSMMLREIVFYFFIFLLLFLTYGAFVHNGFTPLFFLNNQSITLEALVKGSFISLAVIAISFYIKSYFEMFTTTKILFVTAKLSSTLGIFMSMLLRFIPLFKERLAERQLAMKAIGYYNTPSKVDQLLRFVKLWGHTLIITAELVFFKPQVMKARAYGNQKRSQYTIICYQKKDTLLMCFIVASVVCFCLLFSDYSYYYFPKLKEQQLNGLQIALIAIFMLLPTFYELKENAKWLYLQSKI